MSLSLNLHSAQRTDSFRFFCFSDNVVFVFEITKLTLCTAPIVVLDDDGNVHSKDVPAEMPEYDVSVLSPSEPEELEKQEGLLPKPPKRQTSVSLAGMRSFFEAAVTETESYRL